MYVIPLNPLSSAVKIAIINVVMKFALLHVGKIISHAVMNAATVEMESAVPLLVKLLSIAVKTVGPFLSSVGTLYVRSLYVKISPIAVKIVEQSVEISSANHRVVNLHLIAVMIVDLDVVTEFVIVMKVLRIVVLIVECVEIRSALHCVVNLHLIAVVIVDLDVAIRSALLIVVKIKRIVVRTVE